MVGDTGFEPVTSTVCQRHKKEMKRILYEDSEKARGGNERFTQLLLFLYFIIAV